MGLGDGEQRLSTLGLGGKYECASPITTKQKDNGTHHDETSHLAERRRTSGIMYRVIIPRHWHNQSCCLTLLWVQLCSALPSSQALGIELSFGK